MGTPHTTDALLSAAEVRDLIARAGKVLEGVSLGDLYDGDEEETENANRRLSIGMEAYRFALRNAEALEDPALLDAVVETLDINEELLWDPEGVLHEIFPEVLTSLLSLIRKPDPRVEELVDHATPAVRAAVAAGLRPRSRWARTHLEKLAHDFWPSVRVPAQASLRAKREIPDWWGRFESDPLEGLEPRPAAALRKQLDELKPFFDESDWALSDAVRTGKLAQVLEQLPLPLAAGLAERVVRAGLDLYGKAVGLFPLVLRGPEGAGFIERWLTEGTGSDEGHLPLADELADTVQELPPAVGNALRRRMIELLQHPTTARHKEDSFRRPLSRMVGRAWPRGLDPSPVLDLVVAMPASENESLIVINLGQVLRYAERLSDAALERMLAAQQEGWPGRWGLLRGAAEEQLDRVAPERMRPLAERARTHPDDRVATWALRQLLHRLRDEQRDPPRPKQIAAYWEDARLRRLLIEGEPALVLPLLRGELRAGRLGLAHATITLAQIGRFYGGVGPALGPFGGDAGQIEDRHQQQRHDYRDLLGPSSRRGPPSPVEWEAFRAVRAQELEALLPVNESLAAQAVETVPPGSEWDPADRALFWRGVKLAFATKSDVLTLALLHLMRQKPLREDMLILEKLHRIDAAGWGLGHNIRSEIRKELGLDGADEDEEDDEAPPPIEPSAND